MQWLAVKAITSYVTLGSNSILSALHKKNLMSISEEVNHLDCALHIRSSNLNREGGSSESCKSGC